MWPLPFMAAALPLPPTSRIERKGLMAILTSADHEHFIEHGYLVLRGIVPAEVTTAAVAALEDETCDPEARRIAVAACTVDGMLDAIGELFGAGYTLTRRRGGSDLARVHQPDAEWVTPRAHVDDSYPTIMPGGWAVGSFTFLTPVQSHGGAFICFPGSYRRYRQLMAHSCECIKGAAQLPENSGSPMEFLAEAGDVLLFHHLCGHTGSDNLVDPVTRHALLNRWHPEERIVPDDKPFDAMTTIEKVNSAHYQACSKPQTTAADEADSAALAAGVSPWASVHTCAILHFGGCLHLCYTGDIDSHRIHRAVSTDGIHWRAAAPIDLEIGQIRTLQFHQYGLDAILGASTLDGDMYVFSSVDMDAWTLRSTLHGARTATPWFIYAQYPSKVAGGQAVFVVPLDQPDQVVCRWGEDWDGAGTWQSQSVALRAPAGHLIEDVTIAAHFGDSNCTFIVDLGIVDLGIDPGVVDQDNSAGRTRPFYAQPKDVAVAETGLHPLPYDCATAPRNLRILHRARRYWLVTYLRATDAGERMFWGSIDWSDEKPRLRELCTSAQLRQARSIVGLL